MGRPPACNPCCNPVRQGYCTHRKIEPVTPEVEWSRSISTFGANNAVVYGSAVDSSGNLYVGGTYDLAGLSSGTIQKWSPAGVLLWKVNTPVAIRCVTTDGTHVWAGGFYKFGATRADETLYKLNCSNGVEVWRSSWGTSNIEVNDIVHDGSGQVYLAHAQLDCGFVSLVDSDGDMVDRFGGKVGGTFQANAVALDDSGNVFVASTLWRADSFSCSPLDCGPTGNVAKFDSSHNLVWLTVRNATSYEPYDDLFPTLQLAFAPASIDWHDGFLFIGYGNVGGSLVSTPTLTDVCTLAKWNADTSLFVWGIPTGSSVPDVAADDDYVYAVSGNKLLKISEDGYNGGLGLEWCNEHEANIGTPAEGPRDYWTVSLFAGDEYTPDPYVYVGGVAADCSIPDEGECTINECECTYENNCDCNSPTVGPFGGVYSKHCPCEEIPCTVPDTFYGSGCLEGITVNFSWHYSQIQTDNNGGVATWTADFEIPCEGAMWPFVVHLERREVSDEECDGWEVYYEIFHNASDGSGCTSFLSGSAVVANCWCSEDSPYGHPWSSWQADGLNFGESCVCCGESGGGGNEPPGVEVACCEGVTLPTTLTAEFTGCITGTVPLTYDAGVSKWLGQVECSGVVMDLALRCASTDWLLNVAYVSGTGGEDCDAGDISVISFNCDPLVIEFAPVPVMDTCACCPSGGFYIITITE